MDDFSLKFRQWMDGRKMRAAEVADALFVTEQSVRNWRSAGIPPRRQPQVADWMAEVDAAAHGSPAGYLRVRPLIVEAGLEEFRSWERAALRNGQTLTEWARSGLTAMAYGRGNVGTPDSAETPPTANETAASREGEDARQAGDES
jgi:hypothetical protein